jgi:thioredoxin reductase
MIKAILAAYPAAPALLAAEGILIDERTIAQLEKIPANANNETIMMVFTDGTNHTTNSLLWRPPFGQTNTFAKDLGLAFNTKANLTIMAVVNGSTSVQGVYSAGDASSNLR